MSATERPKKLAEYVALRTSTEPDPKKLRKLRDELVELNRPLAIRLARRYGAGGEDEDVLQGALIGITRALETFEPGKGSFSTYAAYWVRHEVQQTLQSATTIRRTRQHRIPAPVAEAANKFRLKHGREPTPEDLGVSRADWEDWIVAPGFVGIQDDDTEPLGHVTLGTTDFDGSNESALRRDIEHALKGVSARTKELFLEYYLEHGEEVDLAELARSKGMTLRNAELALSNARKHIQRSLAR